MKKAVAIMISLTILLFVFTSCGGGDTQTSSQETADVSSQTQSEQTQSNTQEETPTGFVDTNLNNGQLVIYPEYPDLLPRDCDYEVTLLQGEDEVKIPVYNAARKSDNFSSVPHNYRRFCEFAFTEEVTVKVTPKISAQSFVVMPTSKDIGATFKDGAITFTLTKPQNVVIRLNDDRETILSIFAEAPETDVPSDNDPNVIYFKAGLNNTNDNYKEAGAGRFLVPENTTVYLEPGALVTWRPLLRSSNVTLKGRGAFIDPQTTRYSDWAFFTTVNDNINADSTKEPLKNVNFEGVKILDAFTFNICIRFSDTVTFDGVKVLSNQISTDGISIWGAENKPVKNVTFKNCFLYNNDDMLVISRVDSLTVKDSIMANTHRFLIPQNEIGTLLIENVDIFGMETLIRSNSAGEAAKWDSITLRNVHAEDAQSFNYIINIQNGTSDQKNVTLENVSLPAQYNNGINIINTQGVTLTLNNVFVGGNPVRSLSDIKNSSVDNGNEVVFGSSFNQNTAKANSFLNSKTPCDVKKDEQIIPNTDYNGENLLNESGFETVSNPFTSYSNGDGYLYSKYWSSYNFNPAYVSFKEKHSGFYSLLVTKDESLGTSHSGITHYLTPIIKQYGAGVYHIEFYAKLDKYTLTQNPNINVGFVRGGWRIADASTPIDINVYRQFKLTGEWQKFSYDITVTDTTLEGYNNAFLFFGAAWEGTTAQKMNFYLDDVSLTYSKQ